MPTYVYETIPKRKNEKPTRFELRQSIKDNPISEHPETGQKVRRVISGGISISPKGIFNTKQQLLPICIWIMLRLNKI